MKKVPRTLLDDMHVWRDFVKNIPPLLHEERVSAHIKPLRFRPGFAKGSTHGISGGDMASMWVNPTPPPTRYAKNIYMDGEIDLHGMTENVAYDALTRFVDQMTHKKHHWGLVITGKSGVLFEMTPKWLAQMKAQVKSFSPAHPHHGGSGALYVRFCV